MRVFCVSDVHIDYEDNLKWISSLSRFDHQEDVLILGGDLTDKLPLLQQGLEAFVERFQSVIFVPGNHELWVSRSGHDNSIEKFEIVCQLAKDIGVSTEPYQDERLVIIPLLGWYDYSFGLPNQELQDAWMDYRACRWPGNYNEQDITTYFTQQNHGYLSLARGNRIVITFSHFLPRIDVMPNFIPNTKRMLYPILGSEVLEQQVRQLNSKIHVYGHSHVNQVVTIDGICYVNNAFGYPQEERIAAKRLFCLDDILRNL